MAPKKDKKAGGAPAGAEGGDPGENPFTLLNNYQKFCRCADARELQTLKTMAI